MPLTAIAVGSLLLFSPVAAQAAPDKPSAREPVQKDAEPLSGDGAPSSLAGPRVATPEARPTLIRRDAAGKVEPLEVQPAEAAAHLLKLDPAVRAEVDRILRERAAILDTIVADNLRIIVQAAGARESGDAAEAARLFRELSEKAGPLRARGPLQRELAAVLPEAEAAELRRLILEYTQARMADLAASPAAGAAEAMDQGAEAGGAPKGGPGGRAGRGADPLRQEMTRLIGVEIKRSYERVVGQQAADFDTLLRELNVTPEQESTIRKVVSDSFIANYGKTTAAERARVFATVYAELDEAQRATLAERFRTRVPTR